jgi:GAF domain-containing protein
LVGALDLQSTRLDGFTVGQQRVLTAFAERAAAAIENMQLYEKL